MRCFLFSQCPLDLVNALTELLLDIWDELKKMELKTYMKNNYYSDPYFDMIEAGVDKVMTRLSITKKGNLIPYLVKKLKTVCYNQAVSPTKTKEKTMVDNSTETLIWWSYSDSSFFTGTSIPS